MGSWIWFVSPGQRLGRSGLGIGVPATAIWVPEKELDAKHWGNKENLITVNAGISHGVKRTCFIGGGTDQEGFSAGKLTQLGRHKKQSWAGAWESDWEDASSTCPLSEISASQVLRLLGNWNMLPVSWGCPQCFSLALWSGATAFSPTAAHPWCWAWRCWG